MGLDALRFCSVERSMLVGAEPNKVHWDVPRLPKGTMPAGRWFEKLNANTQKGAAGAMDATIDRRIDDQE